MVLRLLHEAYLTEENLESLHKPLRMALLRRLRSLGWYADPCQDVLVRP